MQDYKPYYSFLRYIKKNLNLKYPISIRRVKIAKYKDGDASLRNEKFLIRINKFLNVNQTIDTLIHEVGHILLWNSYDYKDGDDDHGPLWGEAYSEVYRKYLIWLGIYYEKNKC